MTFEYNSSVFVDTTELSEHLIASVRKYLEDEGFSSSWSRGQIQDCLLNFRYVENNNRRLLINQLEPLFTYLSRHAELWPEGETEMSKPSAKELFADIATPSESVPVLVASAPQGVSLETPRLVAVLESKGGALCFRTDDALGEEPLIATGFKPGDTVLILRLLSTE